MGMQNLLGFGGVFGSIPNSSSSHSASRKSLASDIESERGRSDSETSPHVHLEFQTVSPNAGIPQIGVGLPSLLVQPRIPCSPQKPVRKVDLSPSDDEVLSL